MKKNRMRDFKVTIIIGFIIGFIFPYEVFANDNLKEYIPMVVPPSPSAHNLSTHGNIAMGNNDGRFAYSIPIYTIQEGSISLPISVDYSSNGVKVDELSGILGTDWVLNCGGIVSRIMRGKPDEGYTKWYPETIDIKNKNTEENLHQLILGNSLLDTEQDWFSFNVNGISGSFFFDENMNIHVNSKEFVNITFEKLLNVIVSFTIIDNKGYKYLFGGTDNYIEKTNASGMDIIQYNSSWFLKEIVSPTKNKINFTYIENKIEFTSSFSEYLSYYRERNLTIGEPTNATYKVDYNKNEIINSTVSKVLSQIEFSNGAVNFIYDTKIYGKGGKVLEKIEINDKTNLVKKILFKYKTTSPTEGVRPSGLYKENIYFKFFLNELTFVDSKSIGSETYMFDYYLLDQVPTRFSYSKDKYGYIGTNNSYPFDKKDKDYAKGLNSNSWTELFGADLEVKSDRVYIGMLKQINYPTGGHTLISYEPHSTRGVVSTTTPIITNLMLRNGCDNQVRQELMTFVATNDMMSGMRIEINAAYNQLDAMKKNCEVTPYLEHCYFILSNTTTKKELFRHTLVFGENTGSQSANYDTKIESLASDSFKEGDILQLKIEVEHPGTPSISNFTITYDKVSQEEKTVYAGGVRVKEIIDYLGKEVSNKKLFFYNELSKYPTEKTSLAEGAYARRDKLYLNGLRGYTNIISRKKCIDNTSVNCDENVYIAEIEVSTLSINPFPMGYAYSYRITTPNYETITEFVLNNTSIVNGAIERKYMYTASTGVGGSSTLNKAPIANVTPPISNYNESLYGLPILQRVFTLDKKGEYVLLKQTKYEYKLLSEQKLHNNTFNYLNRSMTPGQFRASDVFITKYQNYIQNYKLEEIKDYTYEINGDIINNTVNTYGTAPYFNLIKQTQSANQGENIVTYYKYSPDLIGQLSYMDKLVDANKVGIPIISETKKKDASTTEKQISYTKTTYNEFVIDKGDKTTLKYILPEFVYSPTPTDKRASYNNYDEYGNVIYYIIDDITKVVYIWGYNGQYPVAKIENATYDQVKSALAVTPESLSSAVSPNTSLINGLRTNANLSNALVTTYTYKPLVGVLRMTDPRGVTTYYDYDAFGRLKETYIIENGVKKIIQVNEYHYQNQ